MVRKLISVLLSVMLVAGLASVAFAAGSDAPIAPAPGPDSVPDKEGTLSVSIEGDGVVHMLEDGIWSGVAPGDGTIAAVPGTVLEFQASSPSAEEVSVTLADEPVEVASEGEDEDGMRTWSFSIEMPAADELLNIVFAEGPAEDLMPVHVAIAGDGTLHLWEGTGWHGVAEGYDSFDAEPGSELEFWAESPTAKTVLARVEGKNLAVTSEGTDEDGMSGWTFSFVMPSSEVSLSVVFIDPEAEDVNVAVDVTGEGELHVQENGAWHGVVPDPESLSAAPGDELMFRADSEQANVIGVLFDGEAVPFAVESDDEGDYWTFSVLIPEHDCDLSVVFADADAGSVLVQVSGRTDTVEIETGDGEWTDAGSHNFFAEPDEELRIRVAHSEENGAAWQIRDNNTQVYPDAYTPDYAEFITYVGEWGNAVQVLYTDEPLITLAFETPEPDAVVYLGAADGSPITVSAGAKFPSDLNHSQAITVLLPAEGAARLQSVTMDGDPLTFEEQPESDFRVYEFDIPAGATGTLQLGFSGSQADEITIAPDSPDTLGIVPSIDGTGMVLVGVKAEPQGMTTPVSEIQYWLELPQGLTLSVLDAAGNTPEPDAPVATGMTIVASSSENEALTQRLGVVVSGDVLGNGVLSIAQLMRMASALSGADALSGVYLMAGDLNSSGQLDVADLVAEARRLTRAD